MDFFIIFAREQNGVCCYCYRGLSFFDQDIFFVEWNFGISKNNNYDYIFFMKQLFWCNGFFLRIGSSNRIIYGYLSSREKLYTIWMELLYNKQ